MPRPTKLTPAVQAAIVDAIRNGNTREIAAEVAHVGRTTLFIWLQRGRSAKAPKLYREFANAITVAEAEAVATMVKIVMKAAESTPAVAQWWLERRHPDDWGRKDRVEVMETVRRDARKLAEEMGLDPEELIADAERYLASRR